MTQKRAIYRSLAAFSIISMAQAETVTVFYQGMNNTQAQAARLIGKEGFIYPYTGEKVSCARAIDCIINLTLYPEINEVELFLIQLPRGTIMLRSLCPYFGLRQHALTIGTARLTLNFSMIPLVLLIRSRYGHTQSAYVPSIFWPSRRSYRT